MLWQILWQFMTFYVNGTKDGNDHKMSQIVVKCRKLSWRLSCTPLCAQCHRALKLPTSHSCAHACHCDSSMEPGKLQGVFHKSVSPSRGAHSAWACQAARSSVQEMGPHSSELAVRFANEKGIPCRTRTWSLWVMILLKMAWAPGVVLPYCSRTTGVIPLSRACKL